MEAPQKSAPHPVSSRQRVQTSIAEGLEQLVDRGELAGAVVSLWRDGGQLDSTAVGWLDRESQRPMRPDALFRIASMTKPITSLVALQLVEEGRFRLDDAVVRWAPELAGLSVLRSKGGPGDVVPAHRSITFLDLLTHRAGFTYGAFHEGPLGVAYREALGGDIDSTLGPDQWIDALATLPLVDQPGRTFHYGHSTDLLGLLLARVEDTPLPELLRRRVFEPLSMHDTMFAVPPERRDRRASSYGFDDDGSLMPLETPPGGVAMRERPMDLAFASGGQGLWSTAADYLQFTRVFLGDGSVDGHRLLDPSSLACMCANTLSPEQRATAEVGGIPLFNRGHGFGLGVAVVMEPEHAAVTVCRGAEGTVGWPGAYGGWWQADPASGSAAVFLTHCMPERDQLAQGLGLGAYEAVEIVHGLIT